jgi:hypothetical protein
MITNPKAAEFLKAIDLAESSADEEMPEENQTRWNQVYLALLCVENLFVTDSKTVLTVMKQ